MIAGEAILGVAAIVGAAAITPGPNNLIVMGAAGRGGFATALPAIAGVVAGSCCLLVLAWAGAGQAFAALPGLRGALLIAGTLYLAFLGAGRLRSALRRPPAATAPEREDLPGSLLGVALFQLVNPKSWVLVLTALSALSAPLAGLEVLAVLGAIILVVTLPCLSLWALAGAAVARRLKNRKAQRCFDALLGLLLMGSAWLLILA